MGLGSTLSWGQLPAFEMMAGLTDGVVWDEIAAILFVDAHVKHGDFLAAFLLNRCMLDNRAFYFGMCEDQLELDWVSSTGIDELVVKSMANELDILASGSALWRLTRESLRSGCPTDFD